MTNKFQRIKKLIGESIKEAMVTGVKVPVATAVKMNPTALSKLAQTASVTITDSVNENDRAAKEAFIVKNAFALSASDNAKYPIADLEPEEVTDVVKLMPSGTIDYLYNQLKASRTIDLPNQMNEVHIQQDFQDILNNIEDKAQGNNFQEFDFAKEYADKISDIDYLQDLYNYAVNANYHHMADGFKERIKDLQTDLDESAVNSADMTKIKNFVNNNYDDLAPSHYDWLVDYYKKEREESAENYVKIEDYFTDLIQRGDLFPAEDLDLGEDLEEKKKRRKRDRSGAGMHGTGYAVFGITPSGIVPIAGDISVSDSGGDGGGIEESKHYDYSTWQKVAKASNAVSFKNVDDIQIAYNESNKEVGKWDKMIQEGVVYKEKNESVVVTPSDEFNKVNNLTNVADPKEVEKYVDKITNRKAE